MCSGDDPSTSDTLIAFGLVTGAGLSTCLGALMVFNPRWVALANQGVLAGSLSFSAGVMVYISFTELFAHSLDKLEEHGFSSKKSYCAATLSLFLGMAVMRALDMLVHRLKRSGSPSRSDDGGPAKPASGASTLSASVRGSLEDAMKRVGAGGCPCCDDMPKHGAASKDPLVASRAVDRPLNRLEDAEARAAREAEAAESGERVEPESSSAAPSSRALKPSSRAETAPLSGAEASLNRALLRPALMTGLALALHNFPEGIVTFIATLDDPRVGAGLGLAVAVHNIPEGICVALPVYYATGRRRDAFLWALLSGATEPLGALIAWLALVNRFCALSEGIIFGVVGGMMIFISFCELLPAAFRADPHGKVTTAGLVSGMLVMALSLVAFTLSD
jgi:ZIP family zinc transporter